MENSLTELTQKKRQLDKSRPLNPNQLANLEEWFKVELTYSSNAIEGNTLSRRETALVVEKGLTVKGKSLVEHLEAVNHAEALDYVKTLSSKSRGQVAKRELLNIHALILSKIDTSNAGAYRTIDVSISGSRVKLPSPLKVPELMEQFFKWLKQRNSEHPAKVAADAHYRLVTIHLFVDGNGRTARLLMNLLLMQTGYPPAIIRKEDRETYISSLEKAQLGGSKDDFYRVIYEAVNRSLDIYLGKDKSKVLPEAELLRIGEVAKLTNEPVATIRYWTNLGLLPVANRSAGRFRLYEAAVVDRVKRIQKLQQKRLTLDEIKEQL